MFGLGGNIGPDLTPLKRDEIAPLAMNIVSPSAEIREGFQTQQAVTQDGRVITGFLLERTAKTVSLKTQDGQTINMLLEDVESLKQVPKSLMPERLLEGLSDQEIRDLFGYLRSSQPGR
jgi:putative heme-binding domain-containing protein